MTMQYDVKSVYTATSGTQLYTGRTRLKQFVWTGDGTAGTLVFYDGTDNTGEILWQAKTTSGAQPFQVLVPGEGICFRTGIYVTFTHVNSLTICHG